MSEQAEIVKWAVIENIAILTTIAVCTASVAYFANSSDGIISLLLAFALNYFRSDRKRSKSTEDTAS